MSATSRGPDTARTRGWSLLPRFPEPISADFYRVSGKLRLVAIVLLSVANYGSATQLSELGIDPSQYWQTAAQTGPLWAIDLVLTLVIWRGRLSVRTLRALTYACVLAEGAAAVISIQSLGTVNSHMVIFGVLHVLVYRIAFDFWTGTTALVTFVAGMWAAVIAETNGWLHPQPILSGTVDAVYAVGSRETSAMAMLTVIFFVSFMFANWAVARMRHREQTIRLLRESLYAAGLARIGQHTGKTLCDNYEVGAMIGSGGMGEVYSGHDRRNRRPIAIKLLHPHLIEDPTVMRRFAREAEITGQLGSPHIVEMIAVDEDDGQPFIAFELLEGRDLATEIRDRGPLPLTLVASLITQTAAGIAAAHEASVVHRDLKPANLFLVASGAGDDAPLVKILDFGVSKIASAATALTQEVALLGTPDFMAPEQAQGHVGDVDARADIFALGSIAYLCVTAHRPFDGASIPSILRRIVDEEPRPLDELRPDAPPAVADAIAIAMAKRPEERYADARMFAVDLAAAIAGDAPPELAARAAEIHRGARASEAAYARDETVALEQDPPRARRS